ncbi:hypothetical protein AMTRI_Chr07g77310 [Amborella trichopoda]
MALVSEILVGAYKQVLATKTHVSDLSKHVISTYNKQSGTTLYFIPVNYELAIQVLENPFVRIYKAIVWEKPWLKFMNHTSFEHVLT